MGNRFCLDLIACKSRTRRSSKMSPQRRHQKFLPILFVFAAPNIFGDVLSDATDYCEKLLYSAQNHVVRAIDQVNRVPLLKDRIKNREKTLINFFNRSLDFTLSNSKERDSIIA